jgi:hypothetical protein
LIAPGEQIIGNGKDKNNKNRREGHLKKERRGTDEIFPGKKSHFCLFFLAKKDNIDYNCLHGKIIVWKTLIAPGRKASGQNLPTERIRPQGIQTGPLY